jgi:hypothetical protein
MTECRRLVGGEHLQASIIIMIEEKQRKLFLKSCFAQSVKKWLDDCQKTAKIKFS